MKLCACVFAMAFVATAAEAANVYTGKKVKIKVQWVAGAPSGKVAQSCCPGAHKIPPHPPGGHTPPVREIVHEYWTGCQVQLSWKVRPALEIWWNMPAVGLHIAYENVGSSYFPGFESGPTEQEWTDAEQANPEGGQIINTVRRPGGRLSVEESGKAGMDLVEMQAQLCVPAAGCMGDYCFKNQALECQKGGAKIVRQKTRCLFADAVVEIEEEYPSTDAEWGSTYHVDYTWFVYVLEDYRVQDVCGGKGCNDEVFFKVRYRHDEGGGTKSGFKLSSITLGTNSSGPSFAVTVSATADEDEITTESWPPDGDPNGNYLTTKRPSAVMCSAKCYHTVQQSCP